MQKDRKKYANHSPVCNLKAGFTDSKKSVFMTSQLPSCIRLFHCFFTVSSRVSLCFCARYFMTQCCGHVLHEKEMGLLDFPRKSTDFESSVASFYFIPQLTAQQRKPHFFQLTKGQLLRGPESPHTFRPISKTFFWATKCNFSNRKRRLASCN